MPKVAIYAIDQNLQTTSSVGIYNYTRRLIWEFSTMSHPGFELILLLSDVNEEDFTPRNCPDWIKPHTLKGRYDKGAKRLFSDHMIAATLPVLQGIV